MSHFTYRKYGYVVEITEIERKSDAVRVSRAGAARPDVVGSRRIDSLRRTRSLCVRRLLSALEEFGTPLLCTVTFAGISTDAALASDAIRDFQVRLRHDIRDAHTLFVPELSPRGRIHWHGLIFNVPMSWGDKKQGGRIISYGTERDTRYLAGLWRYGFVDLRQTDGDRRLAYYLAKYIMKAGGEVLFNAMRLIRTTQNFPKEIYINTEFASVLAERFSKKTPFNEWEGDTQFFGHISKKKYEV